ncbi:MAG: hypothetical protein EB067_05535 [Actinobacteria bacterium]|nr:hypothetical protein [Actinomycetota bacterium]
MEEHRVNRNSKCRKAEKQKSRKAEKQESRKARKQKSKKAGTENLQIASAAQHQMREGESNDGFISRTVSSRMGRDKGRCVRVNT